MSQSVVEIHNVEVELLFEWFYKSIMKFGGDGAGVICCANFFETSEFFIKWWEKYKLPTLKRNGYKSSKFFHNKEIYTDDQYGPIVNYHDNNENFMFCGTPMYLDHGEVSFIVQEDCQSYDSDFIIRKIK